MPRMIRPKAIRSDLAGRVMARLYSEKIVLAPGQFTERINALDDDRLLMLAHYANVASTGQFIEQLKKDGFNV